MASDRHMAEPAPALAPAPSSTEEVMLDAARECILAVGWKRTTLTDVARRAGVSRMTIYRTWPDMQTLLADLMTREWGSLSATAARDAAHQGTARRQLVAGVVSTVNAVRTNPLLRKIVDVDPELLLPYLLDRPGRSQEAILRLLEALVRAGQADGSVRAGDSTLLARSVLLAGHGFTISAHTMAGADGTEPTEDRLARELGVMVDRYVSP